MSAVLSKFTLNLANYIEPGSVRSESVSLIAQDKKFSFTMNVLTTPLLHSLLQYQIDTHWVKYGQKRLTKYVLSNLLLSFNIRVTADVAPSSKERLKIGEEEYFLHTTDEISTTSTTSEHEEGPEDIEEEMITERRLKNQSSTDNLLVSRGPTKQLKGSDYREIFFQLDH